MDIYVCTFEKIIRKKSVKKKTDFFNENTFFYNSSMNRLVRFSFVISL